MIVTTDWLKEHIDFKLSLDTLEDGLTALGLESTIKREEHSFKGVIIGKVLSIKKVKNSNHLNLCNVNIGSKDIKIVCAASNVKKNIYVPVAIPGATLDYGNYKIKKTKIRGEISNGMICSEKELGIGDNHEGIMILKTTNIGDDFAKSYFNTNEEVIEVDLTPNRGDCFSHIGIAREISILNGGKIKIPKNNYKTSSKNINEKINLDIIDSKGCPRYCCKMMTGIKVNESPDWLKKD